MTVNNDDSVLETMLTKIMKNVRLCFLFTKQIVVFVLFLVKAGPLDLYLSYELQFVNFCKICFVWAAPKRVNKLKCIGEKKASILLFF